MKKSNYEETYNEQEEDFPETGNDSSFLRSPVGFFIIFMIAMAILTYLAFRYHLIG